MEVLSLGLLRKARKDAGISAEDAAVYVGRTRSFIWRVEAGLTDLKVDTLLRLLVYYDKSIFDVFVRVPVKESNIFV